MVAATDLHRSVQLLQRRVIESQIQDSQGVEKHSRLFCRYASPTLAHQQRVENLKCPERRHEGMFAGLEPVEHVHGHLCLFVGKAPRQSHRSIDDDASHGRASWRNSRIVMPPSESPWVFPKLLSRSIASTTSRAGGDG